MLDWLVADGRVAFLAMAILLLELLVAIRMLGISAAFVANAVSGLGLVAALAAALGGYGTLAVLAGLSLGLVAHLVYLARLARARRS